MEARHTDEIDLTELAVSAIRFLKKNLILIIAFTVIGGVLGFGTSKILPQTYQARLTLTSDLLNVHQCKEIAQSLESLVNAKEYSALASRLAIDEATVKKIRSLSSDAKSLISKRDYFQESGYNEKGPSVEKFTDETETLNTTVTIAMSLTDNASLPELQRGLVNFFSNSDFFKTKAQQRIDLYNGLLNEIDSEIKSLDSLKSRLMSRNNSSRTGEMVILDPSNLSLTKIRLRKEKLTYKNLLEHSTSMQVVDGISTFERRLTMKLLLAGLMGGFVLSFVYVYLSGILKKVNSADV